MDVNGDGTLTVEVSCPVEVFKLTRVGGFSIGLGLIRAWGVLVSLKLI